MAEEIGGQVAKVSGQEGDRVLLSVPMVGFPQGFTLRAGDKVVLVHDEHGPAVRPLAKVRVVDRVQESGGRLTAGNHAYVVQAATVRTPGDGARLALFTIPTESKEGEQVLFIRPMP